MQRFFENTIESTYIKYLLSQSELPLYPVITPGRILVKGSRYVYQDNIYECIKQGPFNFEELTLNGTSTKTISNSLKLLQNLSTISNTHNVKQRFVSNTGYYDSDTHKALGDYLRWLRDDIGTDLMSMYNCFNYIVSDELVLTNKDQDKYYVSKVQNSNTKLVMIPIKYNQKYTIAIDCPFPVLMKSIIYNNNIIEVFDNGDYIPVYSFLDEDIVIHNSLQFNKPIIYKITNQDTDKSVKPASWLNSFEKSLYLAIQLPSTNTSSIVVLEGDYTNSCKVVADAQKISDVDTFQFNNIIKGCPELLSKNDGTQRPFSSKLLQYLLHNTIDNREKIDENIIRIRNQLKLPMKKIHDYTGQWDNELRYILYQRYSDLPQDKQTSNKDILGFVDNDIENALLKGTI